MLLLVTHTNLLLAKNDVKVPADIARIKAPFEMPQLKRPVFRDQVFNISEYGAVEGGEVKATDAIAKAIAACADAGGGTVLVPKGKWLTGPVHLKSNINFKIDEGAELHFSDTFSDYLPAVFVRWEGMECYNYSPLIYALDCENIGITGKGKLIGHGKKWWVWKKTQKKVAAIALYEMCTENAPVSERNIAREGGLRPVMIQPIRCKNVLIEGLHIENGPFWTVSPVYCEKLIVRGLSIYTNGANTDGVNLDSCKYALIEYCYFATGDDSVTLKSGLNEDGWRVGKPCENVVIRHCQTEKGHGAIVIGSEMSGGVQNIYAHDMEIKMNDRAVRIKSLPGRGGFVRNLTYENFKIGKLTDAVVQINMKYGSSTLKPISMKMPIFENITIKNFTCGEAKLAVRVTGHEAQPILGLTIDGLTVDKVKEKMKIDYVEELILKNINTPHLKN